MSLFESLGKKAKQLMEKAEKETGIDFQGVKDKAKDLSQKATQKINAYTRTALQKDQEEQPSDGESLSDEALDFTAMKAKAVQLLNNAKAQTDQAKKDVAQKTHAAAESISKAISEKTGKQVSTDQVKKVAMIAGITLLASGAVDLVGEAIADGACGESSGMSEGGISDSSADTGTQESGSGDVIHDAGRVIAENGGSLNIEPIVIDQDGCQL